ncbi:MAG: leucine-rich repeat protein [Muribaculaceae bacterium]|nr:leucine-rich repeat protein [Muribaculaceae bacterium]
MKRGLLFRAIALLAFLTCALAASAATEKFSKDGIYYQLTTYSDGSGVLSVQNNGSFNTYSGVVNIPDSVQYNGVYYPVTGIGYQAFKNCTGLTAVTIPEGVTMMLNESFAGCTSLSSITLPSTMVSIYNNVFVGCTSLTSITCMNPNPHSFNANNFDASTYANATLKVPLGSKTSYQSTSAWSQFSNIQEINKFVVDGIYYMVTSGNNVSVTYRDSPTYCSYYGNVVIPETVTYHGVTYTVTGIGESAFRECHDADRYLFVTLPNTVTSIGTYAFYMSNIFSIELGNKVSSIGGLAFVGTENTLNIINCHAMMPPSIASNTFAQETLDNVNLWIPRMAYGRYTSANYWKNFSQNHLFYGYDFIIDGVYYGINSYVNTVEVSAYAMSVDTTRLYSAYSKQEVINVPRTVTYDGVEYTVNRVGCFAFYEWDMKELSLPSSIQSIEPHAAGFCDKLETINFSEGVTSIGRLAFRECTSLQSFLIPNTVKSIGYGAFYGCSSLQNLFLGAGVEQIEKYGFYRCNNLNRIISYPLIPPVIDVDVFSNDTYNQATLYAAVMSLPAYQAAVGWRNFYNIVGMHTLDEALNVPGGNIHFIESDYSWIVWNDGERLFAKSGNAGVHNSSSTLSTTVKVSVPSILSFDFKAWGESAPDNPNTTYDECVFMVNGTSVFRYGARDNDWETFTYELQPNVTYQIRWYYHKDVSDNGVGDYFALDNIQIRPKVLPGDVNSDGVRNISDVTALINYVMTENPTGINMSGADVNNDGVVNISDVTALISLVLSATR